MSKRIIRTVFSCILSLFIAIVLLSGVLCHYLQYSICNKELFLRTGTESGYTQELYEEIQYEWENLISITGIAEPDDFLSILTSQRVQADALYYLNSCYSGSADLQTADLRSQLEEKVRNYAYSHNITAMPEAELEANIKDLVDACMSSYKNAITVPLLPKLLGAIESYSTYPQYGMIAASVGIFLLLVFLFFLQEKRQNVLYYATISAATAGIVLVGAVHLASYFKVVARIPVSASALKTLLTAYLQLLVDKLGQYGYQCLITGALLLSIYLLINIVIPIIQKRTQVK